eukprot:3115046-Prymnesium_polylepis.1
MEVERRCHHVVEHEGGAFWCHQAAGHTGPHDPPPEVNKRQRLAPKRFNDEQAAKLEEEEDKRE